MSDVKKELLSTGIIIVMMPDIKQIGCLPAKYRTYS